MVSRVFCPHDLRQVDQHTLRLRHNMVRLAETALNYPAYGAEVEIDPVASAISIWCSCRLLAVLPRSVRRAAAHARRHRQHP